MRLFWGTAVLTRLRRMGGEGGVVRWRRGRFSGQVGQVGLEEGLGLPLDLRRGLEAVRSGVVHTLRGLKEGPGPL